MARIACIDHSYHRVTRSTEFLYEIMRRHGHEVQLFWDDAWQGGTAVGWDEVSAHDVIIMFQSFCRPPGPWFRPFHRNVIYIPMLDQFGLWEGPKHHLASFWEPFQGSKVLNFSNALQSVSTAFGIASHWVRYYQPVREYPAPPREGLHGFFWLRRQLQVPWDVVRRLVEGSRFDSFHLHLAPDPGSPPPELPSAADMERHHITTSTWFGAKAHMEAALERANVYFAPRAEEGIGQSFLEAMARGQCVVAPNNGTMNEYILSGMNGMLYDLRHPKPLDFSRRLEIGARAAESTRLGRAQWDAAENALMQFVLSPSESLYEGNYQHVFGLDEESSSPVELRRSTATDSRRRFPPAGDGRTTYSRHVRDVLLRLARRLRGRRKSDR